MKAISLTKIKKGGYLVKQAKSCGNPALLAMMQEMGYSMRMVEWSLPVASWSSGRHLAFGSGGPEFESWFARSTWSTWERLFTCISPHHPCVKRVTDYRHYPRVTRHL